jgi:hypothetical protein
MTQEPTPHSADDNVRIIRATNELKLKVGGGGFSPIAVMNATKRLENSSNLFPLTAEHDLELIQEALRMIEEEANFYEIIRKIRGACNELKSHSAMFKFPLVGKVADSLYDFCEKVTEFSPLIIQVIALHLKTLKIAIDQGPRAITAQDNQSLLVGLEMASTKALS